MNPLFADRDTLQDALDYGYAVAKASDAPAHVTTALHVLLNTVAKLYTLREEKEKQA